MIARYRFTLRTLVACLAFAGLLLGACASESIRGQDESAPSSPLGATPSTPSVSSTRAADPTTSSAEPPRQRATFDADRAKHEMRDLTRFGPRPAGSRSEARAAEHLASRLRALGLETRIERFELPTGATSRNVVATIPGTGDSTVLLGGHYDTKPGSPGANDNGSGVGVILEAARVLAADPATPTVIVVFFGAEEMIDSNPDHHHYGSRALAKRMRREGDLPDDVLIVDMVGVGKDLLVRSMGRGSMSLVRDVRRVAAAKDIRIEYRRDPSEFGWSDHEPFERAGVPVAWIERSSDPRYHTPDDKPGYVTRSPLDEAGRITLGTIGRLR